MSIIRTKIFAAYYLAKQWFAAFIFSLISSPVFKLYLAAISIVNISTWISAFLIKQQAQTNTIILHYNVDFGIDNIAEVPRLFFLPLSGLIIILINLFLVNIFYKYRQEKLFFHLLFGGALMVNLIILVAMVMIYLINFR